MCEMKLLDHGFGGLLFLAAFSLLISASAVVAAEPPEKDRLPGPRGRWRSRSSGTAA